MLTPCAELGGDETLVSTTEHERSKAPRGAVLVLHGGDSARVSQLCPEGDPRSDCSGREVADGFSASASAADVASRRVQRAWRARSARCSKRLAAWHDSVMQPYVSGDLPRSAGPSPSSVRDTAVGETSGADLESAESASVSARRKRQRRAELRDGRDGETNFSIHDSLAALDAAERALKLSAHSGNTAVVAVGEKESKAEEGVQGGSRHGTSASEGHGASSESESEGAKALMRATDDLIRETWPLLRKARSLQSFTTPSASPRSRSASASVPADGGVGRGGQVAAAIAAEGQRAEKESRQQGVGGEVVALANSEGSERKWGEVATSRTCSPSGSQSPGSAEGMLRVSRALLCNSCL